MIAKNNLLLIFCSLFLLSCGFSSGLYNDILRAQDLITKQQFKKAARIYEGVLLKKPSKTIKIKINFQLGEIYSIYLSNFEKSIYHFKQIVTESNEPKWQVNSLEKLGNIYLNETNQYDKAAESYLKLKDFKPILDRNDFYNFRYGLSLLNGGNYIKANEIFSGLIEEGKSEYSVQAYYNQGLAYFYMKNYQKALDSWFEYLKREKRSDRVVQTKFLIANAYESSEKLKEAYNIYYSILGEYPNADVIQNRLESLYARRVARKR